MSLHIVKVRVSAKLKAVSNLRWSLKYRLET